MKLRICTNLPRPIARLPRRPVRPTVAIVHARKARDGYPQYSDYYSSDEARELSQMMPDPNSLFDDSILPSDSDLGLYPGTGVNPSSSAAATRLFGGDLQSSLDDSLYSDNYSEEFNSFRDPGPDAAPWFSQQSPVNAGLSLDEDIEVLSDEARAFRQWEYDHAINAALAVSSYQLENSVNRYMLCVEHGEVLEEMEVEDAHRGLDASPLAATMLPPWIRAVYAVQQDFENINEEHAWNEEQMSIDAQEAYNKEILEEVYRAVDLLNSEGQLDWESRDLKQAVAAKAFLTTGAALEGAAGEEEEQAIEALEAAGLDLGGGLDSSALDLLFSGGAAGGGAQRQVAGEITEERGGGAGSAAFELPAGFLPGTGSFEDLSDEAAALLAAEAAGGFSALEAGSGASYADPLAGMAALPGFGSAGVGPAEGGSAGQRRRAAKGAVAATAVAGGTLAGDVLSAQQALEDMDAEFDRREAGWDELGGGEVASGWGVAPASRAAGAGRAMRGGAAGGEGFAQELERYAAQYGGGAGGELDDGLGPWWEEDLVGGASEGEAGGRLTPFLGGLGAEEDGDEVGLMGPGLFGGLGLEDEDEEGGLDGFSDLGLGPLSSGDEELGDLFEDEDDDPIFSRSDLRKLQQYEAELERRAGGGGGWAQQAQQQAATPAQQQQQQQPPRGGGRAGGGEPGGL